jgi:LmbE family N-acetylglucosaminyl deacetylase
VARKVEAGTPVHVLVVSDGASWPPDRAPAENIATRDAELRRASRVLGLSEDAVIHHSFPETRLHTVIEAMADVVADAVREVRPDDVFTTSLADPHPDHSALGMAAQRALVGSQARLMAYAVWQWEHPRAWIRTLQTSSRPEAVVTTGYMGRKRAALAEYRSQISMQSVDDSGHTMSPLLLQHFVGEREVFFPIRPTRHGGIGLDRHD